MMQRAGLNVSVNPLLFDIVSVKLINQNMWGHESFYVFLFSFVLEPSNPLN